MDSELDYKELINQGITLMQVQNYLKAKEYFEKAISLDKQNKDGYMHLGNACANLEQLDEALSAFEKVLLIDSEDGEAYFNIGNIYVLKDNLYKCIEFYNKAEEKGFKRVELYSNLAGIYRELGEPNQAIRNLNKAIKTDPMRGDIRVEKTHIYISIGKYMEALETLDDLQKIAPDAFEVYDLKTQIYCALKQYDKAMELMDNAVERFDKDVVLQWIRIKVLVEMADYDKAKSSIAEIKKSEFYGTVSREIAIQESIIYSYENNLDMAAAALERAVLEENGYVDEQCRYLLMNIYLGMKNYDKTLEQAKKLAGTASDSLFCISGMYYVPHIMKLQGQSEEANKKYKDLSVYLRKLSIRIPTFYEAYIYRLLCHKELKEFDKALELADYIENLYPDRFDAYAMRYTIYTDMGLLDKAEEQKLKAKALNQNLQI